MIILRVLTALVALQPGPSVTVTPLSGDDHQVTVTIDGQPNTAVLQRLLERAAEGACAGRFVHYGRYRYELNQPAPGEDPGLPTTFVFHQTITCADEPQAEPPAPVPSNLTEVELTQLEPEVMGRASRFFAAMDSGRWAEAYELSAPELHGGMTLEEWIADQGAPDPALSRNLIRLTWYQNPPTAPAGLYGAVDYSARHAGGQRCGYLIWYRPRPADPFRLIRIDETTISDGFDDATLAQMRAQHCRD